jgi:hypothetical protein
MTETIEQWTPSYLISVLKKRLAMVELSSSGNKTDLLDTGKIFDSRKYYNQAYHYLMLGACDQVPYFLVSLSDLTPRLVRELAELEGEERDFIVKQSIVRIFEDINFDLYHDSISKVLKVKIVK